MLTEHEKRCDCDNRAHALEWTNWKLVQAETEVARLTAWVADLQAGLYVNCVYCGHRYGPGETTPVSMADALTAHVEQCPKHPMSALRDALIWCSGSADFNEGGIAREGWLKICAPLLR
jgi:hypothetical protein